MKGGTKNFHAEELSYMENHPSKRTKEQKKWLNKCRTICGT